VPQGVVQKETEFCGQKKPLSAVPSPSSSQPLHCSASVHAL
jgi:hypothetical protein